MAEKHRTRPWKVLLDWRMRERHRPARGHVLEIGNLPEGTVLLGRVAIHILLLKLVSPLPQLLRPRTAIPKRQKGPLALCPLHRLTTLMQPCLLSIHCCKRAPLLGKVLLISRRKHVALPLSLSHRSRTPPGTTELREAKWEKFTPLHMVT